ncbi:MAG: 4Fe-4S binding protein [Candidatus Zixiibacteriota bacterium]|nr:MAG: 4Fe-4S binding protein [candidate division Zixibacteria bacterium]
MGHMVGKDLYRKLGKKIDGLIMRAPWNDTFYQILKELYTEEEAEVIIKMPYGLSTLKDIAKTIKIENTNLQKILDGLAAKGLVFDIRGISGTRYIISPLMVGIFEYTMMRTGENLNTKRWARLFHDYMQDGEFWAANLSHGEKISPLRALPHEGTVTEDEYVEVLDYEKATAIVEENKRFAIGICSCRHEKYHVGEKRCEVPLETCSSFGAAADYMIRGNFGREVSKSEMLESLERSREMRLVFSADNVKQGTSFICNCCSCCCNVMHGIKEFGYPNTIVTSNYIAKNDSDSCAECGDCAEVCPVNAIEAATDEAPVIDESICIGCGVCALECSTASMKLVKREQRVLHPENTFERVILQALERGNLQNLMFDNPQSLTHSFMRGFVGGFLRLPPVKKALISDKYRSRFLEFLSR